MMRRRRPNLTTAARSMIAALFVLAVLFTPIVNAQLNENCVVSVLNRTTQVKPDGTWVLPNIPAGFGPVRARATCVENGVTQSGQSDFFTVPANGSLDIPRILLGQTTPVPETLTLTSTQLVLTESGDTTQLTVIADYSMGTSQQDVTSAASGTTYIVTNSAIATIDANGLVTEG